MSEEQTPFPRPEGEQVKAQHTPGPWAWFGNANSGHHPEIYLATTHSGRRYVMGFRRWGFNSAQPCFQPEGRGLVDASKLLTFQVGDRDVRGIEQARKDGSVYRYDISGIDCADARLIAAAPELLEALEGLMRHTLVRSSPSTFDECENALNAARAAIAKARGGAA